MLSSAIEPIYQHFSCGGERILYESKRTFEELAAVDLAGGDLEGDDMALQDKRVSMILSLFMYAFEESSGVERRRTHLRLVQKLNRYANSARHNVSR
jgi:hypothetical protein